MTRSIPLLAAMVVVSSCAPGAPEGRDLTAAQASAYFASHRSELENLVDLLDACRPADAHGPADVWRHGSGADRCAAADPSGLSKINGWLEAQGFVAASYHTADRQPLSPIAGVQIVTQTSGLGVSGAMTSFTYAATPRTSPTVIDRRENGSVMAEARALTPAPFHWFWEHSR